MNLTDLKNTLYIPVFILGMSLHSFYILGLFIFLDIVTGIVKSGRINGWRAVTSSAFTFGITFKALIIFVPLIVALTGKGIGIDLVFMARGALSMLIVSEAYSILGNIYSIRTGQNHEEFDAVNWSINKVRESLISIIKK